MKLDQRKIACHHAWIKTLAYLIGFFALFFPFTSFSASDLSMVSTKVVGATTEYNLNIKFLLFFSLLTLLPALLASTTAFTRIIIVFSILRQAIGVPNTPNNIIIIGLSLIMTGYVMSPVFEKINTDSLQPYLSGKIKEDAAAMAAVTPLKHFMLAQTRKSNLFLFEKLSKSPHLKSEQAEQEPFYVLLPAFVTSELTTAFEIGFLIFIPFLIIDLVVSSVLMSMGMMMLSPMIISIPLKLLFFVLVDGWQLLVYSLVNSFRI